MAVDVTRQGTKGGDPQYDTSNIRGVREERGIVTGVVCAASIVCALTPSPKDDAMIGKLYKILEMLALNIGKAKK